MRAEYQPDELLPLSGIQHFVFCRRQWALIYVERQWQDNVLTVEGKHMHELADDPYYKEIRQGVIISRSVPVASYRYGLIGICDVVEFRPDDRGVNIAGRQGRYLPVPVEYKRGKEKHGLCDEVQVCAQALCLEEMFSVAIPLGYLFYGEPRRRYEVQFTAELRASVLEAIEEMHSYYKKGYTPKVKPSRACRSCSLADVCLPVLQDKTMKASEYIQKQVDGE